MLREVHDWIKVNTPPMCVFMADRLPEAAAHAANTAQFEAIAGALLQNQFVAIAPWNVPDRITGAGIILFPTTTSRSILVGALFLNSNFPDFIHNINLLPRSLPYHPSPGHTEYDPAPPNIASSQRHTQASGSQSRYPA
ncbi:hypothetical protein NM688_g1018 [Phlebia brevispora]|uniref:Uncharacterized protein n=1 Tax=Phlebia brevispora TaxID=194682 RepID=A0ACC1TCQ3_9APHY|nr:hypothetical protein NM688_g1018 [Phlebia brevispora]